MAEGRQIESEVEKTRSSYLCIEARTYRRHGRSEKIESSV